MPTPPSRRSLLKSAAALTAASAATAQTNPATTQSSFPISDLAALERAAGRDPYTAAERDLMAPGLTRLAKTLRRLRAVPIPADIEPSTGFSIPPPPAGPSTLTLTPPPLDYDDHPESLAFAPVTRLSALLHAKKISSVELTRMYLDRLKSIGPKLRCVIHLTENLALAQARRADAELAAGKLRGPLHGIPWGAKDLLATKNIPTTWGVKIYEHQVFDHDAAVVEALEAAGAVLVAKLSLGELAMDDVWYGGKTRNPWKLDEGSGGSSAGPGAAIAAGLVGFSIGSETLGSIVDPCVHCGVTGLRPTFALVPTRGAMALAQSMDKLGPMCRSVEDCALVLNAIKQPDARFVFNDATDLKNLKIGIDAASFTKIEDKPTAILLNQFVDRLKSEIGDLRPVHLPDARSYANLAWLTILCEGAANFSDLLTTGKIRELTQQEEDRWPNSFRIGATIPAADYLRAQRLRRVLQREMDAALAGIDAYITAPLAGPSLSFTNLCGQPTLITRCAMLNGRPLSIEVTGNLHREDAILRIGCAISRLAGNPQWPDTTKLEP